MSNSPNQEDYQAPNIISILGISDVKVIFYAKGHVSVFSMILFEIALEYYAPLEIPVMKEEWDL